MSNDGFKEILNQGFGSPGETTRILSIEYQKLRATHSRKDACRKILVVRAFAYSTSGYNIIDDALLERILLKADGEFPFVVFADIFASNNYPPQNKTQALIDNLDIVLEVIVDNYNNIVDPLDQCKTLEGLKLKSQEFINEEIGV